MKKYFSIRLFLIILLFSTPSYAYDNDTLLLEIQPSEQEHHYNVSLFYVDAGEGLYTLLASGRSKPMKIMDLKYGEKIFRLYFKVNTVKIELPETSLPIDVSADGIEVKS